MARHWAETVAKRYLEAKGYTCLAQNYSVRGAELDLVMQQGERIIFVEVRQRRRTDYGSAAESITPAKLRRLQHAALHYLMATFRRDDLLLRFDAVLLEGTEARHNLIHLEGIL